MDLWYEMAGTTGTTRYNYNSDAGVSALSDSGFQKPACLASYSYALRPAVEPGVGLQPNTT